jgi:hypothetical protein
MDADSDLSCARLLDCESYNGGKRPGKKKEQKTDGNQILIGGDTTRMHGG